MQFFVLSSTECVHTDFRVPKFCTMGYPQSPLKNLGVVYSFFTVVLHL